MLQRIENANGKIKTKDQLRDYEKHLEYTKVRSIVREKQAYRNIKSSKLKIMYRSTTK